MTDIISREELWNFVQAHKDKDKEQFGGWLLAQEVETTSKIIKAVSRYNDFEEA